MKRKSASKEKSEEEVCARATFEDIIGSGLTQVNATLQLEATVYPDPQQLPAKGNTTRFPLGPLLLEAELYDIQTQQNFTKEFTEPMMMIQITMPLS